MTVNENNDPCVAGEMEGRADDPTIDGPWSPTALKTACETLAFDATGMLCRTRIEGRVSPRPGVLRNVGLLAKAMAEEFGLRTWLAYRDRIITVTFEQRDVRRDPRRLPDG